MHTDLYELLNQNFHALQTFEAQFYATVGGQRREQVGVLIHIEDEVL